MVEIQDLLEGINLKFYFMRKILFVMATIVAMVMNAHVVGQKFYDNTYVTIKGGATALMHPGCNGYENLGHTFEAATGLEIGKWVTPHWGFSIDGTNGWTNGSKVGVFQDDYAVNYLTVAAMAKYRFMPMSKFNIALAAGPQWIHGFKKDATDGNDIGAKMKIEFNYNLSNHFALQVAPELNYNMRHVAWIPTKTVTQPYFDSRRAWYGLMVGVTYKIGNEFIECPYKYTQSEWDALNAEINDLRSRQPEVVEKVVEKVVIKKEQSLEYVVFFDKNSAILSEASKATLNKINGSVIVRGGASEDGTLKRNNQLSQERADAVSEYLTNRGVKVLSSTGLGVTGNRVAIVTVQ